MTVFLFFKVVTPLLLGAAVFVLVCVLDIGGLSAAGQWCAVLGGDVLGFVPVPPLLLVTLAVITGLYVVSAEVMKRWFYRNTA